MQVLGWRSFMVQCMCSGHGWLHSAYDQPAEACLPAVSVFCAQIRRLEPGAAAASLVRQNCIAEIRSWLITSGSRSNQLFELIYAILTNYMYTYQFSLFLQHETTLPSLLSCTLHCKTNQGLPKGLCYFLCAWCSAITLSFMNPGIYTLYFIYLSVSTTCISYSSSDTCHSYVKHYCLMGYI